METQTQTVTEVPQVWEDESRGLKWCDCGDGDHVLDYDMVDGFADSLGFYDPDRITHEQLIKIAAFTWGYEDVCEFFEDQVGHAAIDVYGHLAPDYPRGVALGIVKYFSDRWNGCPRECM